MDVDGLENWRTGEQSHARSDERGPETSDLALDPAAVHEPHQLHLAPPPPPPPAPPEAEQAAAARSEGPPAVEITVRLDDATEHVFPLWEDVHEGGPGGRLWDAAVLLAQHLAERVGDDCLRGKRVVELGAGLGLPGIVAAYQGAHVTLTDKARCVELMRLNAAANGVTANVRVAQFEWGRKAASLHPPFDLVLVADCVCHDEHSVYRPLLKSLKDLSGPHSEVLISYKHRGDAEDVFWEAAEECFDVQLLERDAAPAVSRDGDHLPTLLYRLTRRTAA